MAHGQHNLFTQHSSFTHSNTSSPSIFSTRTTPSSLGLQLDTFDNEGIRPISIQEATVETLVQHNPHVRKLFNDWQDATRQLITLSGTVTNLVNENQRLRNVGSNNNLRHAHFLCSNTTSGDGTPASSSGEPGTRQSRPPASLPDPHRPFVKVRSSQRPADLPFEVLWNLEDCNEDDNACPGANNASRPPMTSALRTRTGDLITERKYSDIKADVASLCTANLHTLPDIDNSKGRKATGPRTRIWYACWYREELMRVVDELERMHPILALCSGHWKAEHLISNHLNSSNTVTKRRNEPKRSQPRRRQAAEARKRRTRSGSRAGSHSPQRTDSGTNQNNSPKRPRSDSTSKTNDNKRQRTDSHKDPANILGATFQLGGPSQERDKTHDPVPSPESSPRAPPKPLSPQEQARVDVGFIRVSPEPSNLKESLSTEFKVSHGVELISGLELLQKSDLIQADPSADTLAYLKQLEDADPNMPDLSEDDDNEAWGHYQYRANGLTPALVLKDWTTIGNTTIAYRLLAASIRTSRVARYLVNVRKRKAQQYTSDAYIDIIVSKLWEIVSPMVAEQSKPAGSPSQTGEQLSEVEKGRERLKPLHVPELKKWAQEHQISLPPGKAKKQDIIDRILASSSIPTDEEVARLVATR
ncbi:hypothetical protein FA13DRAFT_1719134 [Coprinellus micaceus]|uniref:SAP domain-containing protein n=1 Tax=Coprinellus micaceus TaxID=71717 RepID=A0A4Y7SC89_COPMI|nr:hypothetical protein FA13DRAFT_1719134 [Coprinellus micaceus]